MANGQDTSYLIAHEQFLQSLAGQAVTGVCIRQCSIELMLDTAGVSVEGCWQLTGENGELIDSDRGLESRESFLLWRIVGTTLERATVQSDRVSILTLTLSNGWEFLAMGDEDGLEDWEVTAYKSRYSVICNGTI